MSSDIVRIDSKHPDYREHEACWDSLSLLYRGGHAIRKAASRFLVQRPAEAREVYQQRLERFTYQNVLSSAVGWYVSKLFEAEPAIDGNAEPLGSFIENADGAGCSLFDLATHWFRSVVLYGGAYVLIDLPPGGIEGGSLADQKAAGLLDPHLVSYTPSQVTNWDTDERGELEWIVIHTTMRHQQIGRQIKAFERWHYFDRERFDVYERSGDNKAPIHTATGPHALASEGMVPVVRLHVPHDLWLADRAYPQILDHLNQENSFAWALFQGNLAVPVITGEYEAPPVVSETAYIHLTKGSSFTWTEPGGSSYAVSAQRVQSLREEIYRSFHLQAQGRTSTATASAASGYSKEMDMAPSKDVLNAYGAILREAMHKILDAVAIIRTGKPADIEIRGYQFSSDDPLAELEAGEKALSLDIPSDTWRREVRKRVARNYLGNLDPATTGQIDSEIDAAPSAAETAAAERSRRRDEFAERMRNAAV